LTISTPIPQPTPLTNPNGIQIQSAVLPKNNLQKGRQTDRQVGQAIGLYQDTLMLYSDAANKKTSN